MCFFFTLQSRITLGRRFTLNKRITGYDSLVTTPGPLFRRSIFVVGNGLMILKEEPVMRLTLSLSEILHTADSLFFLITSQAGTSSRRIIGAS